MEMLLQEGKAAVPCIPFMQSDGEGLGGRWWGREKIAACLPLPLPMLVCLPAALQGLSFSPCQGLEGTSHAYSRRLGCGCCGATIARDTQPLHTAACPQRTHMQGRLLEEEGGGVHKSIVLTHSSLLSSSFLLLSPQCTHACQGS